MPHQPLALQICNRLQRSSQRSFGRAVHIEHQAQVDDVERLQPEVRQIVLDGARELVRFERRQPRRILAAARANLGDDQQVVRVG